MKIKELKELTGLTLIELSKKTGISYNRISKLNREIIKHSMKDHELIQKYMKNRRYNVIHVEFKQKNTRVPFSWERRGEIDLVEYRNSKRKKQEIHKKTKSFREYQEYAKENN